MAYSFPTSNPDTSTSGRTLLQDQYIQFLGTSNDLGNSENSPYPPRNTAAEPEIPGLTLVFTLESWRQKEKPRDPALLGKHPKGRTSVEGIPLHQNFKGNDEAIKEFIDDNACVMGVSDRSITGQNVAAGPEFRRAVYGSTECIVDRDTKAGDLLVYEAPMPKEISVMATRGSEVQRLNPGRLRVMPYSTAYEEGKFEDVLRRFVSKKTLKRFLDPNNNRGLTKEQFLESSKMAMAYRKNDLSHGRKRQAGFIFNVLNAASELVDAGNALRDSDDTNEEERAEAFLNTLQKTLRVRSAHENHIKRKIFARTQIGAPAGNVANVFLYPGNA